ncbi:MAG: sigma-70 family RNA polymerase sigma factor [Bacteroidales bacterium]
MKHKLFRMAKRMLVNTAEAEDMVQEVMIRLWARKDKLHEYNSIEAFAMTITKNLCLDKLKSKRNKTDELSERNGQVSYSTPYHGMEISDSYKNVLKIIDSLPEQQRMIIHLRDIEGYEYEEISEVMDLSVNTIRVNLSRARKKVKETMIKMHNYEFAKN